VNNDVLTVGVEEEFFVVDDSGHLSGHADAVVAAANDHEGELQKELAQSQAELATGICRTHTEILHQLHQLRGELASAGARMGLRIVPSGAALLSETDPPGITEDARYLRMAEQFGALVHKVRTCGCHVHVAIPDRETGVQVINHVRPWLPILLAVTANSPIESGRPTGYRSWRHQRWNQWPSAGPPPRFGSLEHYESIIEGWQRSGAIMDRGMIYWDVRLSDNQPTLEFRVGDVAAIPEEATLLAVLVRGLTHLALNTSEPSPDLPNEVLRGQLWRAARDGLAGQCPHPHTGHVAPAHVVLKDLLTILTPALRENGDLEFAEENLARLARTGGGADRQLRTFAGADRAEDVIGMLAVRRP
jgi:carboxylate-amine ligase